MSFDTLLIANRGEIARRVMRTAKAMGLKTVAVYSDADASAPHVREADMAVHLGPAPARESYLKIDAVIAAAQATGAQAIHPGYGFLSENAAFARACADAGIIFVGPTPEAIEAMGLKDGAKALMAQAGVPITPAYHGAEQDAAFLAERAGEVGYPVLIKAVAGGGGKGMRRVDAPEDFAAALDSCRREAANAFGDDRVLIEKFVTNPRHIEVQIVGDQHGNVIHAFERDCSLQRRHQKVIEEAPAPGMTPDVREAMCAAAVQAGKAVNYQGAGTIEFIVDGSGPLRTDGFYFMEMNTRLQVEHPVTEEITGLDLVEWQIRVARGEPLPPQDAIQINGHAMEARLYAEDPATGFLPAIGPVETLHVHAGETPAGRMRWDAGVEAGGEVTPHYDPMIGKLIAWGPDREGARVNLLAMVQSAQVGPVRHNLGFLGRCLEHADFASGEVDTGLIGRADEALTHPAPDALAKRAALIGLARLTVRREDAACAAAAPHAAAWSDPWAGPDGFRANAPAASRERFALDGAPITTTVREEAGLASVAVQGQDVAAAIAQAHVGVDHHGGVTAALDGETLTGALIFADPAERAGAFDLHIDGDRHVVAPVDIDAAADALEAGDDITAPMPGKVIALSAQAGASVDAGQTVLVLEAMKMEHALASPRAGAIASLAVKVGDQVKEGDVLARLEAAEA